MVYLPSRVFELVKIAWSPGFWRSRAPAEAVAPTALLDRVFLHQVILDQVLQDHPPSNASLSLALARIDRNTCQC